MSLTTRLMGLNSDGSTPASNADRPKIPIRVFWAQCIQLIRGRMSVATIETYWDMNAGEISDFAAIRARAPTGTSATALANKALFLDAFIAIVQLGEYRGEGGATAYTLAEVNAELAGL